MHLISREERIAIKMKARVTILKLSEDICWIIKCINWLPPGFFLWSSKLSYFKSGLFGVLAVLFNLIAKIYS